MLQGYVGVLLEYVKDFVLSSVLNDRRVNCCCKAMACRLHPSCMALLLKWKKQTHCSNRIEWKQRVNQLFGFRICSTHVGMSLKHNSELEPHCFFLVGHVFVSVFGGNESHQQENWTQKKKTSQKRRKYCRFGEHLRGDLRLGPTPVRLVRFHVSPKKLCVGMVVLLFNRGFTLVLTALRGMIFWIEGKQLYTYLWFLVVEEHAEWRFLLVNG